MDRWEDIPDWLVGEAEHDLSAGEEAARPCLVAYAGPEPLLVAFLRPFPKGEYHDALTEVLALAAPLGADRLAFSATGRAWSLDDPIAPVTPDADLRQRVLMIEVSDAAVDPPAHRSMIVPFDEPVPGQPVRWHVRRVITGSEGWIADALRAATSPAMRAEMRAEPAQILAQMVRADALGHLLALAPAVEERLARCCPPRRRRGHRSSRRPGLAAGR